MSVQKITQVTCDGSDLLMTRLYAGEGSHDDYAAVLAASRGERHALTRRCAYEAREALNVKDARERAAAAGWIRHRETVRKYYGTDQTERRTFDLCPRCAPLADPAEQQRQAEMLVAEAVLLS